MNVSESYVTDFLNVKFAIPYGLGGDIATYLQDFEYGKRGWIEILNTVNEALQYKVPLPISKAKKVVAAIDQTTPSVPVIPESLFKECPAYIVRIVNEINGTYKNGYYTASAILMRRLVETCMIEAFEKKGLADQIRTGEDYKTADEIKNELLKNPFGNLSRNDRKALNQKRNILRLGDMCAHDRFYFCQKMNIDSIVNDVEVIIQYLICQFT